MNLRNIANGTTRSINPNIKATLKRSAGYDTDSAGKRTPKLDTFTGDIQVQAMSTGDLRQAEYLNLQGVLRAVYINGNWAGVVRGDQKGGDLLQFPEVKGGAIKDWLVVNVAEAWPDWTKVIVCLQT